jgi:2-keto-4-pentenoate hydratase/2-oxohepta-3-ene-1,7-dioic acid hydratase in catechol pathway
VRLANLSGRAVLVFDGGVVDIEKASAGRFSADPQAAFEEWDEFRAWADTVGPDRAESFDSALLGPPVPRPRQIFAIGINYAEHAAEAGYPPESLPVTFTKFPSCLVGPDATVTLPTETVDWEVEAVVAISRLASGVSRLDAWSYIAGITVGQDLSERVSQMVGTKPQYSLAKSYAGFGPTGPWLVTPDEFSNPGDLEISCALSGEVVQSSRTSQMVYDVPTLIERLSGVCTLLPGDLIFTGTPAGVGNARTPKWFIKPGDVLVSRLEGVGELTTRFI